MNYPLFLSYQGTTIGNGFVAEITARAQMLATIDKEGAWIYGVRPGAIAESGDGIEQAHVQIRETLRLTFVDFADEAQTFAEFRARVERFFNETNDDSVMEWDAAVAAIRQNRDSGNLGLPTMAAELGMTITVAEKTSELRADMNVPPLDVPMKSAAQGTNILAAAA